MRVPSFEQFKSYSRYAGIFIAGMIVGAAALMVSVQGVIQHQITEHHILKLQLDMLKDNVASRTSEQEVISWIDVYLDYDADKINLDPITAAKLRRYIQRDLEVLKGKRVYHTVSQADGGIRMLKTLFLQLYEDVDGKDYRVEINHYSIVYGVLTVWASIHVYQPN